MVAVLEVAPVAMMMKKRDTAHRNWGRLFFLAMTLIFVTAIIMSIYIWTPFLLMVAVFSYYFVVSGYRWLYLKKMGRGAKAGVIDWLALALIFAFSFIFTGWGIGKIVVGGYGFYAYLAIVIAFSATVLTFLPRVATVDVACVGGYPVIVFIVCKYKTKPEELLRIKYMV